MCSDRRLAELVTNFKTAWESLRLIANGHETAHPARPSLLPELRRGTSTRAPSRRSSR